MLSLSEIQSMFYVRDYLLAGFLDKLFYQGAGAFYLEGVKKADEEMRQAMQETGG